MKNFKLIAAVIIGLGASIILPNPALSAPCASSTVATAADPVQCEFNCTPLGTANALQCQTQITSGFCDSTGRSNCTTTGVGGCHAPVFSTCAVSNDCTASGGNGRQCSVTSGCCSGNTCEVVGNQPLKLWNNPPCPDGDLNCIEPVKWLNGFSNGVDVLTSGAPAVGADTPRYVGFTKMCVDNNPSRRPSAPLYPAPGNLLLPPSSVAVAVPAQFDTRIVKWNDSSGYLECQLQQNDKHRVRTSGAIRGCACDLSDYEPVMMTPADYIRITYDTHFGSPKLDRLWGRVMHEIQNYPLVKAALQKTSENLSKTIENAWAVAGDCTGPGVNGSGPNTGPAGINQIMSGDACDTYNQVRRPGINGTCTTAFGNTNLACNPSGNPLNRDCRKLCLLSSDIAQVLNNPPDIACSTTAGLNGQCKCGAFGTTSFYYRNAYCSTVSATNLSFTPNTHAFPVTAPTVTTAAISVRIFNPGPGTASNCTVSISRPQDYVLTNTGGCATLTPGASCTLNLAGRPSTAPDPTLYSANLSIDCTSLAKNSISVEKLFADLIRETKSKASQWKNALVPEAGACSLPSTPYDDCNQDPNTYTGVPESCCCLGWNLSASFVSKHACQCSYYAIASGCTVGDPGVSGRSGAFTIGVPTPPSPGLTQPLYVDSGYTWNPQPALWSPSSQNYGSLPGLSTPGKVVGCARKCPMQSGSTTIRVPRDPVDPLKCDCAVNGPIDGRVTFDPTSSTCIACPAGSITINGICNCPYNYEVVQSSGMAQPECRPKMPSAELIRTPGGYPVCGAQNPSSNQNSRLPTTYGFDISASASHGVPNTNDVTLLPLNTTSNYRYSVIADINGTKYPNYHYSKAPHCACSNHIQANGAAAGLTFNSSQFSGDTLDFINAFKSDGTPSKVYGMVAIAHDGIADGRTGNLFTVGSASCACPNVNEIPSTVTGLKGPICAPAFADPAPGNVRIFAIFDPLVDDISGKSQVITKSNVPGYSEPLNAGSVIVSTVSLASSQSAPSTMTPYQRRIWKCQMGYNLNLVDRTCEWGTQHQCDSTSPVAKGSTWSTLINKKLACCMNSMPDTKISSSEVKFDCFDNSKINYANFNDLWASSDPASAGNQLNAVLLTSGASKSKGKPLTGFYTLDGARCDEFSEFSSVPIQPGSLNPSVIAGQQATVGTAPSADSFLPSGTPLPTPASASYLMLVNGLGSKGLAPKPISGAAEVAKARRCPILVRAAIKFACPPMSKSTNTVQLTHSDTANGPFTCPSASSIQIHLRAEQIFQITGQASMIPIDTVLDQKIASSISIEQMIREKYQNRCLPGMVMGSSGCRY